MEKKKVALFLPSLAGGGAERVMVSLAEEFSRSGHDVDLVLAKAEGPYLDQVPPAVRIIDLNASRVLYSLVPLVRYLKKYQPESILSALSHANIIAVFASLIARINTKTVVSIHSNMTHISPMTTRPFVSKWISPLIKWSFQKANKVIAVSQGVAEDAVQTLHLPKEKVQVIYNPVVDEELIRKANEQVEHPWFAEGMPPVLLAVGRLTEVKDFPTLIRAFAKLRKTCPVKLIILGEGEKRSELESLIHDLHLEEDVDMPGFAENPYAYMKRARLFVLSSISEGLPTVLIEALACGTEVISTDCPSGPKEILKNGKYGTLVPVGHDHALYEAMKIILETVPEQTNAEAYSPFWKTNVSRQYLDIL
ncbi:glycosyltransferase [Domibacillus iocasae]|uniref:Glycosyl transferase n=1 Tax=Domibacillus iocasae TaxID=1714016 RepID=A0A1E7DPK8_9BACI|nr:glycosyltransferase [Domibacillus iocasae]OES44979.1 glycosyl transferase [Domibacillus iocasae]